MIENLAGLLAPCVDKESRIPKNPVPVSGSRMASQIFDEHYEAAAWSVPQFSWSGLVGTGGAHHRGEVGREGRWCCQKTE